MPDNVKGQVIHNFEWGAGSFQLRICLPREIRQIRDIEEALMEGYIPHQVRSWPVHGEKLKMFGIDNMRNTFEGYSATLNLKEIDVPDSAEAYVPSGCMWSDRGLPRQMIVNFLYFKKH